MNLRYSTLSIVDDVISSSSVRLDPSIVEEAVGMITSMVLDIGSCDEIMVLDIPNYFHYVRASMCYVRDSDISSIIVRKSITLIKKYILDLRMVHISDYVITGSWVSITYEDTCNEQEGVLKLRHLA